MRLHAKTPEYIVPTDPGSDGLVAYYPFDGNANDASGNGNNGTLNGSAQFTDGVEGSALDCDGTDGYVSTGKTASDLGISGNAPRTVSVWVYTRGFANGGIYDVGARTTGQDFCLRTLDSTQNRWRIQYWGGDLDFSYNTANEWVHFTHVHDGTYTKIYANGVLIVDWEKTIDTTDTNPFQIGALWMARRLFQRSNRRTAPLQPRRFGRRSTLAGRADDATAQAFLGQTVIARPVGG